MSILLFKKTGRNKKLGDQEMRSAIIARWKAYKQKIAAYLQQKSEMFSIQTKKFSLIFFCVLFGGSSVAIIIHSTTTKQRPFSITKLSRTAHSIQEEKLYLQADSAITKNEYDRVEQFKAYMFQLKADSFNNKKFDSIIQARPLLMDSIKLFEKMYLQQK